MLDLLPALFTLVFVLATVCGTGVVTVLSVALPLGLTLWMVRRLGSGDFQLVVSGPLVALAGAGLPNDRGNDAMVKRSTCPSCGAPKSLPSRSAYVYCDCCGQLMDWDFQAALADKRSRMPGPKYEALVRGQSAELARHRASGDVEAYEAVQRRIFGGYVDACPAACSPRVGDPRYREAFVAWSAHAQALQDLDPTCAQSFAAQQSATAALQWDRSNPFAPRVQPASFGVLLEAVLAHQGNTMQLLERDGLLDTHPDHPSGDVFRKIGVSAMTQGWLPYLPPEHQSTLIARTGMEGDYVKLEPVDLTAGVCGGCSAPLEVVPGAQRVVCYACGHLAAVGGGELPCHGCGAPIVLDPAADRVSCSRCDVELRRMRIPKVG